MKHVCESAIEAKLALSRLKLLKEVQKSPDVFSFSFGFSTKFFRGLCEKDRNKAARCRRELISVTEDFLRHACKQTSLHEEKITQR